MKASVLFALLFPLFAFSQHPDFPGSQRVWLIQPGDLYANYEFEEGSEAKTALLEVLPGKKFREILELGNELAWPEGMNSLEKRQQNADLMKKYLFWRVASFTENGADYCVAYVSKKENKHMPDEMQPLDERGMYMIFNYAAFADYDMENPTEQGTEDIDVVEIVDAGELYSSFDLLADSNAVKFMAAELELAEEEMKNLDALSRENAWPKGINDIEKRRSAAAELGQYTAWNLGNFVSQDNETLCLIYLPFDRNQHMAEAYRPLTEDGFFMVFGEKGVKSKTKR